ncbi:hypothetical protein N7G274_005635 [Stereocaulon virgatum]|uniref:Rhodopsin domain-containing protein n=1 Tax=Stereocaulon virgatum TaxID=373712 RepID=A0ABR4A9R0_9LECA
MPPPDGDRNRGAQLLGPAVTFTVLATMFTIARVVSRTFVTRNFGLDDLFMVAAIIIAIITQVLAALAVMHGLGRHQHYLELTPDSLRGLSQALKWQFLVECLTCFTYVFIRISICLFLLRLFGNKKRLRWALYCLMAFVTATNLSSAAVFLAQCRPLRKVWDPSVSGTCVSTGTVVFAGYYNGAVSVVCDWTLAGLPIFCMWKVQVRPNVKIGICILMAMGFFSGVCALVRSILEISFAASDLTWDLISLDIASSLEQNIGIIAACLPTLKPLFGSSIRWSRSRTGTGNKFTNSLGLERQPDEDEFHLHKMPRNEIIPLPISVPNPTHAEITATKQRMGDQGCWISRMKSAEEASLESSNGRTSQMGGITKTTEIYCESSHDSWRGTGSVETRDHEGRVDRWT